MTSSKESKQQSRRDKLREFIAKRQILEDEKRKKSKPVFRAGGVVQHPYSAFGNSESYRSLHNYSKLSTSTSNLSLVRSNNSSFQKAKPRLNRSASLTSFHDDGKILNVIVEDKDFKSTKGVQRREDSFLDPQVSKGSISQDRYHCL